MKIFHHFFSHNLPFDTWVTGKKMSRTQDTRSTSHSMLRLPQKSDAGPLAIASWSPSDKSSRRSFSFGGTTGKFLTRHLHNFSRGARIHTLKAGNKWRFWFGVTFQSQERPIFPRGHWPSRFGGEESQGVAVGVAESWGPVVGANLVTFSSWFSGKIVHFSQFVEILMIWKLRR